MTATEVDYFARDSTAHDCFRRLRWTRRPYERFDLIATLADIERHQADIHEQVFGTDPLDDGTPGAEWKADGARLLEILAAAELGRSEQLWSSWLFEIEDPRLRALRDAVAEPFAAYASGGRRRRLIRQMCAIWGDTVSGQAIENVWTVGHRLPWWSR